MKTSKLYPPGRILVAVDGSPASRKALAFAGMLRRRCRVQEVILGGEAAATILHASRDARPDLIVMGGERKSSVFGGLFSNTTERVIQLADGPLPIVPSAILKS